MIKIIMTMATCEMCDEIEDSIKSNSKYIRALVDVDTGETKTEEGSERAILVGKLLDELRNHIGSSLYALSVKRTKRGRPRVFIEAENEYIFESGCGEEDSIQEALRSALGNLFTKVFK